MGSIFARPPARGRVDGLSGMRVALDGGAEASLDEVPVQPPVVVCLGAERDGVAAEVASAADASARIPMRPDGPESLNVAIAAAIALHELRNRMAGHG
jgi:tRNA G18 (ribose-2'-O)-methylase SpoU